MVLRRRIALGPEPHGRAPSLREAGSAHGASNREDAAPTHAMTLGATANAGTAAEWMPHEPLAAACLGARTGTGTAGDGDYGSSASASNLPSRLEGSCLVMSSFL